MDNISEEVISMANYDPNVDYQAKINELKKVNPNDPQIAVLQEQRQAKIDDQNKAFVGISPTTAPVVQNSAFVTQTQPTIQNPSIPSPVQSTPTTVNMGITLGNTSIGSAIKKVNQGINPVTNNPLPQPVTNPAHVTPAAPNQPDPNKPVGVRDYLATQLGVDASLIGFQNGVNGQPGRVTVGGMPLDIEGLNLKNGSSYATPEQIQSAFPNGVPITVQNNNAILNQGMNNFNNALDQFNNVINNIQATPFTDQYAEQKKELLAQMGKPFEYNPETDLALKQAANLARKNVLATMNARGILNSTITEQGLADVETTLIPQYRQLAFDEYNRQLSNVLQKLEVTQGLTEFDYTQYRDWISQNIDIAGTRLDVAKSNLENMYKVIDFKNTEEQKKIDAEKIAIEKAMNRTNLNGYVSNKDAIVLGVKPGTLSEAAQTRAAELKQYQEQKRIDISEKKDIMALEHKYALQEISARQVATQENTAQKAAQKQAEKDPYSAATDDQRWWYDYLTGYYLAPDSRYGKNPDEAYRAIASNPSGIKSQVGSGLYDLLLKQAAAIAGKVSNVVEKQPQTYQNVYSSASSLQNSKGDNEAFNAVVKSSLPEEQQAQILDRLGLSYLLD